jgi:hypothetical protein
MSDEAKSDAKAEQIATMKIEIDKAIKIIEQLKSSKKVDSSLIKEAEDGLKELEKNKSVL